MSATGDRRAPARPVPSAARRAADGGRRTAEEDRAPVVRVHERDGATGARAATGIHRDELVVPVPFPAGIDLTTPFAR